MSAMLVFGAALPAVILVLLFFFDHNVASMLTQAPQFNLKKGPSFHWDSIVLGVSMLVSGMLGLPPCNANLPQSPMHVRSLAKLAQKEVTGGSPGQVEEVCKTRLAPWYLLVHHL